MPTPKQLTPLKPTGGYGTPNSIVSQTPGLTPRTPHSRALDRRDDDDLDEIDLLPSGVQQQQTLPLLESASSPGFREAYPRTRTSSLTSKSTPSKEKPFLLHVLSQTPLGIGIIAAIFLLFLISLSISKPKTLQEAVGIKPPVGNDQAIAQNAPSALPSTAAKSTSHHSQSPIIDYSKYKNFPLTSLEYAEECWTQLKSAGHAHGAYWDIPHGGVPDVIHKPSSKGVCKSSITYMLDGTHGLLAELAVMAQVAGLARETGRSFFVEDKYWTHGKWSDYFHSVQHGQPGPEHGCLPPPPDELVACPRQARHWIVSFRTAKFHLGHDFDNAYEDAHARGVQRQRPIYTRALDSFKNTIRPNKRVSSLIQTARSSLLSHVSLSSPLPIQENGTYISVHIRRGDSSSQSWGYGGKPLPVSEYVSAVEKILGEDGQVDAALTSSESEKKPVVFIASDSKKAVEEFETIASSSSSLGEGSPWKIVSLHHSPEGSLNELAYPNEDGYFQKDWKDDERGGVWSAEERVKYTTGMVVDFALLSGFWTERMNESGEVGGAEGPRKVVCTITSTICRMAAVGLGFDRAFGKEMGLDWVEIDAKGNVEPVWQGYQLVF